LYQVQRIKRKGYNASCNEALKNKQISWRTELPYISWHCTAEDIRNRSQTNASRL